MAALFGWALLHQFLMGLPFPHVEFIAVNVSLAGCVVGLLVGTYDVRSRTDRAAAERDRERLERERAKVEFLNRALRHHVLNGMNVVQGRAQLLESAVDDENRPHLETLQNRSEAIVGMVERIRNITRTFDDDPEASLAARNLSASLAAQAAAFDDVAVDAPATDCSVVADASLEVLLENLLAYATDRSGGDATEIRVDPSAATVALRVTGAGWDVPADRTSLTLDWQTTLEAADAGVELAIVNALATRYGGEVLVESGGDDTALVVALPGADEHVDAEPRPPAARSAAPVAE